MHRLCHGRRAGFLSCAHVSDLVALTSVSRLLLSARYQVVLAIILNLAKIILNAS